jgi:hypothetical protein
MENIKALTVVRPSVALHKTLGGNKMEAKELLEIMVKKDAMFTAMAYAAFRLIEMNQGLELLLTIKDPDNEELPKMKKITNDFAAWIETQIDEYRKIMEEIK